MGIQALAGSVAVLGTEYTCLEGSVLLLSLSVHAKNRIVALFNGALVLYVKSQNTLPVYLVLIW